MAIEIERKFLVSDNSWLTPDIKGISIKQAYLKNSPESVVRIRTYGDKGFITIKGNICGLSKTEESGGSKNNSLKDNTRNNSISRLEFEYEIPLKDALDMLELCGKPLIEKVRYLIDFMGFEWSVDIFEGSNSGLIVAEIELESENQEFDKPSWIGEEVTSDPKYLNSNLIKKPLGL